jgi:PEP-CTERM/exosortase A-associated glycosyltransferase
MSRLYTRLCEVIKAQRPEVLHAHSPVLNGLPTIRAGRRFNLPVVYEIRAFWEDAASNHGSYRQGSLPYRATAAAETWACRRATHVAVLCEGLRRDLIGRGIDQSKITPVPNAADLDTFRDCAPAHDLAREWGIEGKTVVGFIGSFYDYEGLDLLVDAFAEAAARNPKLVLLLVGGGRMADSIRQQTISLGIEDKVVMPGRIPHDQVPGVYKLLDLAVFPRHSMRLTELVTPLKPMEAMAMRTPCLASDVGGHRELVKHGRTGFLFEAGNRRALTDALLDLSARSADLETICNEAHDWVVRERNWKAINSRYEGIYSSVTGG